MSSIAITKTSPQRFRRLALSRQQEARVALESLSKEEIQDHLTLSPEQAQSKSASRRSRSVMTSVLKAVGLTTGTLMLASVTPPLVSAAVVFGTGVILGDDFGGQDPFSSLGFTLAIFAGGLGTAGLAAGVAAGGGIALACLAGPALVVGATVSALSLKNGRKNAAKLQRCLSSPESKSFLREKFEKMYGKDSLKVAE